MRLQECDLKSNRLPGFHTAFFSSCPFWLFLHRDPVRTTERNTWFQEDKRLFPSATGPHPRGRPRRPRTRTAAWPPTPNKRRRGPAGRARRRGGRWPAGTRLGRRAGPGPGPHSPWPHRLSSCGLAWRTPHPRPPWREPSPLRSRCQERRSCGSRGRGEPPRGCPTETSAYRAPRTADSPLPAHGARPGRAEASGAPSRGAAEQARAPVPTKGRGGAGARCGKGGRSPGPAPPAPPAPQPGTLGGGRGAHRPLPSHSLAHSPPPARTFPGESGGWVGARPAAALAGRRGRAGARRGRAPLGASCLTARPLPSLRTARPAPSGTFKRGARGRLPARPPAHVAPRTAPGAGGARPGRGLRGAAAGRRRRAPGERGRALRGAGRRAGAGGAEPGPCWGRAGAVLGPGRGRGRGRRGRRGSGGGSARAAAAGGHRRDGGGGVSWGEGSGAELRGRAGLGRAAPRVSGNGNGNGPGLPAAGGGSPPWPAAALPAPLTRSLPSSLPAGHAAARALRAAEGGGRRGGARGSAAR